MTRDESIDRMYEAMKAAQVTGTPLERMRAAEAQVDALVALGVLQLDGAISDKAPAPRAGRCEPPPAHRLKYWHWLRNVWGQLYCALWLDHDRWFVQGQVHTAEGASQAGWRYIAVCQEPKI